MNYEQARILKETATMAADLLKRVSRLEDEIARLKERIDPTKRIVNANRK